MKKILFALICFASCYIPAFCQYYSIYLDTQSPQTQPIIDRLFSGNNTYLRAYIYENGSPLDLTGWDITFRYSWGQYDTNGMVTVDGTISSNHVDFLGSTNVYAKPYDKYYWSISGINLSGNVKTFGTGTLRVMYDPATSTNVFAMMEQVNITWLTNYVGVQVNSNLVNLTSLTGQFGASSTQVNNALGLLTTNLATEYSRATNAEFNLQVNIDLADDAIAAETSRATNNEAIISNYVAVAVAGEYSRATNVEFNLQANIDIASNVLNTAQTSFVAQVGLATNNIKSLLTTATTNQAATNALFQSFFNTQVSTNALLAAEIVTINNATNNLLLQVTNNLATQQATNALLLAQIQGISVSTNVISRYMADNVSNVYVLASGTGITATRTNEVFYFNIPDNVHIISMKISIDEGNTSSGVIRLAMGANDVPQGSPFTSWSPSANGFYASDSPYNSFTVTCQPDVDHSTWIKCSGFGTTAGKIDVCHFVW